MIEGKVGTTKFTFENTPKGKAGETTVRFQDGRTWKVNYFRDDQGIWIETPNGYAGFDVRKSKNDDGEAEYALLRRKNAELVTGARFLKSGEGNEQAGAQKQKKGAKVKSQMPGKILRISVKAGDSVQKGQSLLVMEAMKMENEIKSPEAGVIKEIKVKEGQAVETGAELLLFS